MRRTETWELDGIEYECDISEQEDGKRYFYMSSPALCPQSITPRLKEDAPFCQDGCDCEVGGAYELGVAKQWYGVTAFDDNPGPSPA